MMVAELAPTAATCWYQALFRMMVVAGVVRFLLSASCNPPVAEVKWNGSWWELTGAIEIAQVTLVSTYELGVTVSESDGVLSTMRIGVPVLKAKKKLAPPCTRQDAGAKEYVFDVYPCTVHVPYSDAMICPSMFCAATCEAQKLAAKAAMKGTAFRPYVINKAERVLTPACPGEPWEVRFVFICLRIKSGSRDAFRCSRSRPT